MKIAMKIKDINFHLAGFFTVLVLLDQFSKYLIRSQGGFYYCNENIAFSLYLPSWIFPGLWLMTIVFLSHLFFSHDTRKSRILSWSIVAIFSGAIGNLLDRIIFGCVLDFIKIGFWPAFNLADSYITLGVVFFLAKKLKM